MYNSIRVICLVHLSYNFVLDYFHMYLTYCAMAQDDILPKLMTSTGSQEDLFRKELSKYDNICQEIAQNLETQGDLLMQIQVCSNSRCISSSVHLNSNLHNFFMCK